MKTYSELLLASSITTDDLFDILKNEFIEDDYFNLRRMHENLVDIIKERYIVNIDEINEHLKEIDKLGTKDEYNLYFLCRFVTEPNNEYFMNMLNTAPYSIYSVYFTDHKYDSLYSEELIDEIIKRDNRNFIYFRRINFEPNIQLLLAERLGKNYIGLCKQQTVESQLLVFENLSYRDKLDLVHEFPLYNDIIFKENYELCDLLNDEFLSIVIKTAYIMKTRKMYNSEYPVKSKKFLDYYETKNRELVKRSIFEISISDDGDIIEYNILPF